jgi:integrase
MATLRSDHGSLLLDFRWQGRRCREYLGLDDTKEGRASARLLQKQIEAEVATGSLDFAARFPRSKKAKAGGVFAPPPAPTVLVPVSAPVPTIVSYGKAWLARQRGSNAYLADLASMLDVHVARFFGERTFDSLKVQDVETFMLDLRHQGLGGTRANKVRALLSRLCERAMRDKLITENPVLDVKPERGKRAEVDPLSFEEVKRLLTKGLEHDPENRRFYTVKIFTGLRTSELIGLKWDDLDLVKAQATICRSVTKLDGEHETKTEGSERTIDLRPQVIKALQEQRASSQLRGAYVFPSLTGGARDRDNMVSRVWRPALKRAGLRARKEYQTRHSFACLALEAGESIGWVSAQLGHVNTAMVIKHYYRWVRNETRRDGSALDRAAAAAGL